MKRDEALRELSRDHHQALHRAMRMKRATDEDVAEVRADVLGFWREHGGEHFRIEEEILLPGFAAVGDHDDAAVVRVLTDHVWIRERIERLAANELSLDAIHELGERLDAHVRHEERTLFPMIERALDSDALVELGERIAAAELAAGPKRRAADPATRLRAATAGDVPRLTELVEAAYGHYVERLGGPPRPLTDDYAEVVRERDVTVAEREGGIVGLIVLDSDDEGFLVDNVAVDPAHRGTGVGRALLEWGEAAARRAGYDSIYLYTHERMTENLALYGRVGYVEYDRRQHGGADIVYLRKRLR